MNIFVVFAAVIILAIGFPFSVIKTMDWEKAEYIYGGIQDLVLILLIGYYYAV